MHQMRETPILVIVKQSLQQLFYFAEVRTAAIDSICELSTRSPNFASLSQDFIIDMFNDEIESIRLNAIESVRKISQHLLLREDQLDIILAALKVSHCFILLLSHSHDPC